MALQALAVDLTGSAVITADLTGEQRRVTSHDVSVLASGVHRRVTSANVKVLYSTDTRRVTGLVVKVLRAQPEYLETSITSNALIVADLSKGGVEPLEVDITGSAAVTADFKIDPLATDITGSAIIEVDLKLPSLRADLTGSATFEGTFNKTLIADITVTTTIAPDLTIGKTQLVPDQGITGSATIWALIETNLTKASNTITFSQLATAFNEHVGNTLVIEQDVATDLTVSYDADSSFGPFHNVTYEAIFTFSVENTIVFDHLATAQRTLPTNTASNTIVFTQDAEYASCLLYTSPSPRDGLLSRMPSSA